jgi:hypothetical protein
MSLGTYPALGLADARIRHAEKRARVLAGADPLREKRAGKEARTTVPAFGQAADDYIAAHERSWKTGTYRPVEDDARDLLRADPRSAGRSDRHRGRAEGVAACGRARPQPPRL